jgi:hypothetical protein
LIKGEEEQTHLVRRDSWIRGILATILQVVEDGVQVVREEEMFAGGENQLLRVLVLHLVHRVRLGVLFHRETVSVI